MPHIMITHVYLSRGVVSAWASTDRPTVHHVGHHPFEGWFCTCSRARRCKMIDAVKALVPVEALEAGARGVRDGTTPTLDTVRRPEAAA